MEGFDLKLVNGGSEPFDGHLRLDRSGARRWRRLAIVLVCLLVSACGLPRLEDIRQAYQQRVEALGGLTAVYPPREGIRIGQLWIGDTSITSPNSGATPRDLPSMLLSDELVPNMEAKRAAIMSSSQRFARSPDSLAADLGFSSGGEIYYKQATDDTLEVAAMPKYTLAAVTQEAFAGTLPQALSSFFAALGFSQTKYLTVEAIGVEIADLPVDTFSDVVSAACKDTKSGVFGNPEKREIVQRVGYNALEAWWEGRKARAEGGAIAKFAPQLYLVSKVYYLRGLRYIFNDNEAASAAVAAALSNKFATGVTPPSAPAPSPPAPAASPSPGAAPNPQQAQIDALTKELTDLKTAVAQNTNTNVAASYARATAQGVEMVDLFQRPVAFGYVAFAENLALDSHGKPLGGIGEFCSDFSGN
jgi:hypothetical protein